MPIKFTGMNSEIVVTTILMNLFLCYIVFIFVPFLNKFLDVILNLKCDLKAVELKIGTS